MASIFSLILAGDVPGQVLHRDERTAALLTIEPVQPGHALVVPIEEVDSWLDLEDDLAAALMRTAARVGRAQREVLGAPRTALLVAGFDVAHTHLHVIPAYTAADASLADAAPAEPNELARMADRLRGALG